MKDLIKRLATGSRSRIKGKMEHVSADSLCHREKSMGQPVNNSDHNPDDGSMPAQSQESSQMRFGLKYSKRTKNPDSLSRE